ncbi:hypothetical protein [Rhizobium sullae]|uniref:Uncharacterized protein n=1 Tax=Rhizobium sullae TaxID=50338 RepID=A0A4R3PSQ2_RHISU|nr:hypothetical protein [Rhizobium sullae]TCU09684.1 hypothetical protein EV132_12484 [Rhizobium sullae]
MTATKHPKTRKPSDRDLKEDPGIGRSKGLSEPTDDEALQGENTIEGDVANDTTPQGGINPRQRGRTNK